MTLPSQFKTERVIKLLLRHRFVVTVAVNLAIAAVAYLGAFALRFDLSVPQEYLAVALSTLPLLCFCKFIGFWYFGLFSGWWRHVSVRDVEDIVRANFAGSAFFLATMVFFRGLAGYPRSIFLTDFVLCTVFMGATRVALRLLRERGEQRRVHRIETLAVIVGAGSAGIRLLQELESRPSRDIAVVGFIDDDAEKVGMRVCGAPVLGRIDNIPEVARQHDVGEVFIAIPSAPGPVIRHAIQKCREAGVRSRVLPSLGELVEGRFMYTQMREVKVDDLLGRAPIRLDAPHIRQFLGGRCVLVTGAAGSIGSELCRQVAGNQPARLVLYDRHENGVFTLEMELRQRFPDLDVVAVLGDVLLQDQLDSVFSEQRPQVVFHAAAYKHVWLAERNPVEAVRNNILGTRNVAVAAASHGVHEFVLVSTDKAVRPTSVMGACKRVAEMLVQGLQNGAGRFVTVRFGNVLGSNGSVVPLFRDQIARGGPVTVTHPEVTRFFMTIPEAVQLILQAATIGHGGEILVLEMGQPVRIAELARHMVELSGFVPGEDIEIVFTGLRPGEKLHEELVDDGESVVATELDRILTLSTRAQRTAHPADIAASFEQLVAAGDTNGIVRLLCELVPTYQPSENIGGDLTGAAAGNGLHRGAHGIAASAA
jgi:FlaA1/EpsC-like NDP-sugar epimerase